MIGNLVSTWIIPRLGGNATLLAPKDVQTGAHIAVSPDGKQVATAYQDSKAVRVFPIDGGSPSVIQMGQIRWLIGLDWGRATNRIAVLTQDDTKLSTVWTVAPDGSDRREVYSDTSTLASLRWSPFGNVLYIIRANGEVGDVIRLEPGAGDSAKPNVILPGLNWDAANPYSRHSSLSTDGRRLLHLRGSSYSNLHRMNTSNGESSEITMGTLRYGRPAVSPDGRWIATAVGSYAKSSVVKIPIQGGDPIPLTSGDSLDSGPVWSPDGERLAFVSSRGNSQRIWMVSADGGPAVEVPDSAASTDPGLQWTSDGRLIWLKPGEGDHVVRQVATGSVDTLVKPPPPGMSNGIFTEARASKTGDVVAVWWNRTVSSKQPDGIWLIFKSTREERLLYQNAFFYPAGWSPDGQWLYAYEYLGRDIIRVPVSGGKFVQVGKFPLGEIESCATTPDGREVICAVGETKSDAWLAENFDPQAPQPPGR
jgi:Tol biopolymer transport system component